MAQFSTINAQLELKDLHSYVEKFEKTFLLASYSNGSSSPTSIIDDNRKYSYLYHIPSCLMVDYDISAANYVVLTINYT